MKTSVYFFMQDNELRSVLVAVSQNLHFWESTICELHDH